MESQEHLRSWKIEINEIEDRCEFTGLLKPTDKDKVSHHQYHDLHQRKSSTLLISDKIYRNLKRMCHRNDLALNSVLQFVWHKTISIYGNTNHTVIGTTVFGIGSFPMFVNHNFDASVAEAMKTIADTTNKILSQSNVDFSQFNQGHMKQSLFDCLFVYENCPTLHTKNDEEEQPTEFEKNADIQTLDYPLVVVAYETVAKDCVTFVVNYASELFDNETIVNLLTVANDLFTQIGNGQVTRVSDLYLLPTKQLKMINEWNNTYTNFVELNTQTTLHKLFEEEAEKSCNKIAIVYEDVQLTYRELNEKANQLAHYLRSIYDIQPDDLIALFLDKSELIIVSILGVWKSGAAYVPIDPSYPDERIQFILQDTKAKLIITNKKYVTRLDSYDLMKIEVDCPLVYQLINKNSMIFNPDPNTTKHNLAYVMYTSGTTGKPKGVLIEHGSVASFRNDVKYRYFGIDDSDAMPEAILFLSNYVFDFTIEQIALSILSSNTLIIPENTFTIDDKFYAYLNKNRLTYLSGTPTQMQQMDLTKLYYLQALTTGGEPVTERAFEKLRREYSGKIRQVYGVTETTVYNMAYVYENDMKYKNSIGSLLSNTKRFVLNKNLQMLPIHAIGELYLTGNCVSRGYLNRPELTAERFLPNPFQTDEEKKEGKNARIYKTGDLVCWLPDGELEYLDRNNLQVKIRQLKISSGRIEEVLSSYQGVDRPDIKVEDQQVSNTNTSPMRFHVAYYHSDDDDDDNVFRTYVQTKSSDYPTSNQFKRNENKHVTSTNTLGPNATREFDLSVQQNSYCAPRNDTETKLCEIWSDVLGIETVGITDDFFRLGGDSISSLQLVSRVRQEHNLNISVKDIFTFKTTEQLFENKLKDQLIQSNDDAQKSLNGIELTNSREETGLLSIQEYLLKRKGSSPNRFNQHVVFQIARFDENKFKECLAKLVSHHEVFRIRFRKHSGGKYYQYYQTNLDLGAINLVQVKKSPSAESNFQTELNNLLIKTTDIEKGPLYMVGYSYDHEDNVSAKVWIFMHDFIVDLTSCRIISEYLQRLYIGSNFDSNSCYKQCSDAVKSCVNEIGTSETEYWQILLNANVNIFNAALAGKQLRNYDISETEIILTEEITNGLLNDCNKIYNTQIEHILLTALGCTLRDEITSLKENYVMFECCTRDFVNNLDMNRSTGMFRTIYPVRLQLADDDVRSSIINVKEHMKQVPNKGIGFCTTRSNENDNLPWVSFHYLGLFENENNENGREEEWRLLDAFCENTMDENTEEFIKINSLIINTQMRLNIKTKMGIERTARLAKAFQCNIEKIIKHTQSVNRSYLTSSDVNYVINNNEYLNRIQLEKEVDAIFMANSLQQGLLYHSLKQSNVDDAYIVQSVLQYRTNIDQKLFKMAWEHAQRRFSSLRLRFDWQEKLIQIIDKKQALDWRFIDLTTEEGDVSNQESKIKQIQEEDRNERFKLNIGNLFRVYLIQQRTDLFVLIFSFHHIILDGWSLPILLDYIHQDYLDLIEDKHPSLPLSCSPSSSFRDQSYENAQMYLQKHRLDNIDYWENEINKIEERCDLTGLLKEENKNKVVLNQYDHVKQPTSGTLIIGDNFYKNLKNTCRENGLTLSSILQFVWHKILSVYGNSSQTVIGTTVSGRNLPVNNIETSVGLFINTLPLIVNHSVDGLIIDGIKSIQDKMNEMITRSNVDFSQLSKGKMKHSLFDSLFVYENYPNLKSKSDRKQKLLMFEKKYEVEKLDYPLSVVAYEIVENKCVTFIINYAGELFEEETIDDLLGLTNELLTQIVNNQVKQMFDLKILPMKQLNKINEWNNTDREFTQLNKQTTLHKLFEEEAEKSSDKIAVIYEDVQLTYRELNEKANHLAHYLRSICDIRSDDLIALFLDKSELMIVSILAVWKSGAAYVPIDPSYPDERIQFILQDTKAKVIIANKNYTSKLHSYDMIKIEIDSIYTTINDNKSNENPHPISSSSNLAYVIYTSGTTGYPKGVMIEHTGVINLKIALTDLFELKSRAESVLSFSNYVFDHFVEQMTYALLNSQVLVILNDEMRVDKLRLYQYLKKNKVTYLSGTPSVLQEYDYEQLNHLIRIDAVGEDFSEITFNKIRSKFNGLIINGYGPTEISITSHKKLYYVDGKRVNKSIGKQIANTSCYVLDKNLNQLPIGTIGELYIGGIGVARGYLNRPELTAERFLPNPFQTEQEKKENKNARIYKTGDLVRWLPNGELEYLGRNDFQVKIRGLRIELGEIEAVLSSYQGVKQSVVIAKDVKTVDAEDRSRKYLLGYFVSEDNVGESDLKQYMQTKLPDYMIPNRLVRIEKIPVNISGKLDSRALPEVDFTKYDQTELAAPRNDLEAKVAQIWSELLSISVENIGIHDDFFSLGGDSILVMKLSLMLTNSLSVKLSVPAIFQNKTIAKLVLYILHGLDDDAGQNNRMLRMSDTHANHPNYVLSFAQERLLFINEFDAENGTNAYNIAMYIKFSNNNVRRDLLYQSLLAVIYRHEILRTLIREDRFGIISQHLLNETETDSLFKVNEIHVANNEQLDDDLMKLAKYVFNLRKELPIKVTFYELNNEDGYDFTTLYIGILMHHICFDGWSWNIFRTDLEMFYDYLEKNADNCSLDASTSLTLNLPPLHVQYKDFAAWQRNYLTGKRLNSLLEFWTNKLDGFEMLNLIADCSIRPSNYDYTGNEIMFQLNEQTTTALKQLAMKLNVSLFSLLLSAYTLMLSNYTNQQDIVIGTPVANRDQPELESLIGFFVNMLVLRIKVDPQNYTLDYIKKVSSEVINAQIHQEMPFERLVKELQIENDPSRHPIVQVMFIMNNQFNARGSANNVNNKPDKSMEMLEYLPNQTNFKTAKYDVSTSINEIDICLKGHFNFATKIFNENTIYSFIQSFIHILTQFSQLNEACKVLDIDCTNAEQYNQIKQWNNTVTQFTELNKQTTLSKLFEEEAEKSPDKLAVIYEDVQLTYRELNQKANHLAHYLRSISDIRPDDLIALFLDKSELMIVSILAVWKSGAAYVPIDPSYPDERIQFILQDTKAKVAITNKKYTKRLVAYDIIKIEIDCPLANQLVNKHRTNLNPDSNTNEHNLAYVIYTSGTTGKPKGVLIEHESVVSFRNDITTRYFDNNGVDATPQAILLFSNYVFDFSIEQLALSIFNSRTLIILSNTFTIDDNFYSYLNKNRLTYLSGTPTQLQQINFNELKYLKTLTIAGEALTETLFEKIRQAYKGRIINAYGVTETTVYNMVYIYQNGMKYKNSIGTLLSNTKRFVLSKNMQILPVHAIGELYLTGICMARGYLNRPELTAERFLPNPFQTDPEKKEDKNARIYKTGDLVRWLPDGEIEYLGRNDFQVKIRGLRIELGEIETILSSYQGVKQSIVLAKDHKKKNTSTSSTKYLVGYYISDNDIAESNLKQFMQTKLPNYMIPNRLIRIDKIPVTINGKLDTRALPDIDFSVDEKNDAKPRNGLEMKLCELWSDLLGIENVGITDDFFRLGGDSISSLQIVGRIRKDHGLSVSVKDIFVFKTIKSLCENVLINNLKQKIINPCELNCYEQDTLSGEVPLLPIQEWFFLKHSISINHWNQSFLIETPHLDLSKLNGSLIKLIDHHDAFKLRFKQVDHKKYIQYYDNSATTTNSFLLNYLDIRNLDQSESKHQLLNKILTSWQSQFDIENGTLFAVGYLTGFADGTARIWFAIHHLIVDVVSWRILCEDLQRLYNGSPHLGRKGSSYRQWSQLVQSYAVHHSASEEVYWRSLLSNVLSCNDDLSKHDTVSNSRLSTTTTSITLNTTQTSSLLRDCSHAYNAQINVLLLTALGYALKELTQNQMNCVTLEGHGREDIDGGNMDISRTVGWFTTMYPVVLEIDDDLRCSIMNVKEHLTQVPNKGIGYGTIIGYKDQELPRVSFNYLGQFEAASSTKANSSNINSGWYLIDGIVGDEVGDNQTEVVNDGDMIAVNGLCMKGQIGFNIKSRLNSERTIQFASSFKSKLEEIIRECFATKPSNTVDYSNDFEHPFVIFNENADNILFILPPGEGGAESYFNNIVPHLSQYKLVIFNNYYLDLKAKNMEKGFSFEALARLYIKYIKQIQVNGPYNFLGWSFGGVLSFEISRQLNDTGDKIDNIFMIDSYFNVSKASFEIGKIDEVDIIDPINSSYLPMIDNEIFGLNIANRNINIVLFKANKVNEGYSSDHQLELFTYYSNTSFNNLDTLVNHKYIQLFQMHDDSHFSWVFHKEQIVNMSNYIASVLK